MWLGCDLVQTLVYAENGRSVDTVLVGGEVVLKEGKSVRINEVELEKQAWQLNQKVQEAKEKWLSQMTGTHRKIPIDTGRVPGSCFSWAN